MTRERRCFASLIFVTVMLAGAVSQAEEAASRSMSARRGRAFVTMASKEAPAILDLRYHTLDRTRVHAARVELTAFRGVILRPSLIAQIASAGTDTLSFGSGMVVCSEIPRAWMKRCRGRVEEAPPIPDRRRLTTAELNLTRSLALAAQAASGRGALAIGHTMLYGIEPEPLLEFELRREMLVFLARIVQDSRVLSAALALEPTSSIRAIAEAQASDRERVRATYVEIEGYEVVAAERPSPSTEMALAGTGALLFGSGLFGQKLLHGSLGDALAIRPQPWPLGLQIGGIFRVP
jgi:hypothetical protein